jgi:hypothetical protein
MPPKHLALGLAIAAAMPAMFATAQDFTLHSLFIGPVHSPARASAPIKQHSLVTA